MQPMVARDITLPVEPDEAWDAVTDPELLEQWFGDGDREAVIEEVEPGERLSSGGGRRASPARASSCGSSRCPPARAVGVREAPVGPFAMA